MTRRVSAGQPPATDRAFIGRGLRSDRGVGRLVSVAGMVGLPVLNAAGAEVARVADVVAQWTTTSPYPPLGGLVLRVGRRRAFLNAGQVASIDATAVRLSSARLSLEDFERRDDEIVLLRDVMDHQIVDVNGVQVVRAADLYLAAIGRRYWLVGVDVSPMTLLRRLGPRRWRPIPTPDRVVDWAAIQPFPAGGRDVPLTRTNADLRRLRPGELADLLESLAGPERRQLLLALEPESAADALEEMQLDDLVATLRDTPTDQAARLVASMEPDEAAEALRSLDDEHRARLLAAIPIAHAAKLTALARFASDTAGGLMTTMLLTALLDDTVDLVRESMVGVVEHRSDIDAVVVIDARGRPRDDVSLFDLLVATGDTPMANLVDDEPPLTVALTATLREVVTALIDSRRSSLVVVDTNGVAVGRILADDVVDALSGPRGRRRHRNGLVT